MPRYDLVPGPDDGPVLYTSTGPRPTAPPVGFLDPLDLIEAAKAGIENNWREFVADKAAKIRSEALAQALAAAASGGPLGFVANTAAGFVGGQVIPAGSYSIGDYVGASAAANAAFLRATSLWPRTFPAFLSRPVALLAGPWAVGGTVLGHVGIKQLGPAGPNDSLLLRIARGVFLVSDQPEDQEFWSPDAEAFGVGRGGRPPMWWYVEAFGRNLHLTPFWERDP